MPRFRGRSEEPADPACFDELLTLDLYLRENAKSRPDWAPDQNEEKDAVIEFYKKEEAAHHYLPELEDRSWKQLMRMTHLEVFPADPQGTEGETVLLFDYSRRDPLTGNAEILRIDMDEYFREYKK